jgi:UDP-GlcNAc:undecaprenyl-phosphate GlcNAc-1-phosphate transferase
MAGFRISAITHPMGGGFLDIGLLDYPATVLWIVGVTNAFNLIDGLDGLASGVGIIASLTIGAIAFMHGDLAVAALALLLAGALLGFLRYNFNPARIFLGDSGSLTIGFLLAVLSIQSSTKGSAAFAMLVPVLSLGLPIADTTIAMMRRFLRSFLPTHEQKASWLRRLYGMFLPDRRHIHHQLISMGLSHRRVVLVMYAVSWAFGLGAFAVAMTNTVNATLILAAIAVATLIGLRQLQYREMAILQNGMLLPLYQLPVMNRGVFLGFCDLVFAAIAFYAACLIKFADAMPPAIPMGVLSLLPVVCGIQLTVMYAMGLYQGTIRLLGMGDLLRIFKIVIVSALLSGGIVSLFMPYNVPAMVFVIDFYILLSLVVGIRISFHALNYVFLRQSKNGQGVLIYGADTNGALLLQHILNDPSLNLTPIGFLDDTPELEGKRVNGFRIFGGHWKLERLAHRYRIGQILLSDVRIKEKVLHRLSEIADRYDIMIKQPQIHLEDVVMTFPAAQGPSSSAGAHHDRTHTPVGISRS